MPLCASPRPGPAKGRIPLTPGGLARVHRGLHPVAVEVDEKELEMVVMTVPEFEELIVKPAKGVEPAKLAKHFLHAIPEIAEFRKIVEELGFRAQVRFQKVNGVECVILSGRTGLRQILHRKATHLKVGNPKVIEMVIGSGGLKHALLRSFKFGVVLSAVVNTVKVSTAVVKGEMGLEEAISSYLSSQAVDVGKVALSSLAGYLAGVALAATGIAVLPFAGAVLVGVAVGLGLDYFFPTKDLAKTMEKWIRKMREEAKRIWEETTNPDPGSAGLPEMAGADPLPPGWSLAEAEFFNGQWAR